MQYYNDFVVLSVDIALICNAAPKTQVYVSIDVIEWDNIPVSQDLLKLLESIGLSGTEVMENTLPSSHIV
jgi:hypothetical protein